jgi:tRNA modification GTPase
MHNICYDVIGTTRDIVDVMMNIGGYPVVIGDTAGIRDGTVDIIEMEGINRAKKRFVHIL